MRSFRHARQFAAFLIASLSLGSACEVAHAKRLEASDIEKAKKIVIYRGSFDPITEGHEEVIRKILRETNADLVVVVPSRTSGVKRLLPLQHRLKMLDAAFASESKVAYPLGGELGTLLEKNGVISLAREIRRIQPKASLIAAVGGDVARSSTLILNLWQQIRPESWVVVSRDTSALELAKVFPKERIQLLSPASDASSSRVRSFLSSNPSVYFENPTKSAPPRIPDLSQPVSNYLLENGLYLNPRPENYRTIAGESRRLALLAFRSSMEALGLSESYRSMRIAQRQGAELTEIVIDGKPYPVTRRLGAGMYGSAYLLEIEGKKYVAKVPHSGDRFLESARHAIVTQRWLAKSGTIAVPEIHAFDAGGAYVVSEFIEGVSLLEHLKSRPMPAEWEGPLRDLYEAAATYRDATKLALDLRADNIIIREGIPYLVDLGTLKPGADNARTFADLLSSWRSEAMAALKDSGGCFLMFGLLKRNVVR